MNLSLYMYNPYNQVKPRVSCLLFYQTLHSNETAILKHLHILVTHIQSQVLDFAHRCCVIWLCNALQIIFYAQAASVYVSIKLTHLCTHKTNAVSHGTLKVSHYVFIFPSHHYNYSKRCRAYAYLARILRISSCDAEHQMI